jgi:hypothetical protein
MARKQMLPSWMTRRYNFRVIITKYITESTSNAVPPGRRAIPVTVAEGLPKNPVKR